ncbi:MAG: phosphatase PAP2 family protein [Mailhella sp.]|nr:phosphatase PAP2 family protein [Mailhella sp.]
MIMLRPVRPYPWKECLAVILPLLAAASALGVQYGWRFPDDVFAGLRGEHPVATDAMFMLSKCGAAVFYVTFAAVLFSGIRENSHDKITLCVRVILYNIAVSLIILHFMKDGLGMPRPGWGHEPVPWSGSNRFHSFPSGHTAEIVGLALSVLGLNIGKARLFFLSALVLAVGLSRIWLGAHHPADLLAGLAVGFFAARLAFYPVPKKPAGPGIVAEDARPGQ